MPIVPGALVGKDINGNLFEIYLDANGNLITEPVSSVSPSQPDNTVFVAAQDLITSALRLINVQAADEPPDPAQLNDALGVLNQMIDSWNTQRLLIFTTGSNDYPLVGGKQSYTIGTGGDYNTQRPVEITGMSVILNDNPANPIEIPLTSYTVDQWQTQVPVKNVSGTFPQIYYDDGGFPLRTLNFWPIPNISTNTIRIYSWQQLTWPATLATTMHFPQGYAKAFRYNLAVELAPEYGKEASATVQRIAIESMAVIKTLNAPDLQLISDLIATEPGYNYKADLFGIGL